MSPVLGRPTTRKASKSVVSAVNEPKPEARLCLGQHMLHRRGEQCKLSETIKSVCQRYTETAECYVYILDARPLTQETPNGLTMAKSTT